MGNKKLTLGSLFDGSGGFPLGGILAGIEPKWASEIEPFTIRVTTKRLPKVKHLGDINSIDGGKIEPVEIITFGSPCTDMSIAGKRAGLNGKQSGLFHQAIRVIKEMRSATNGKYPRFIVWENVVGALSSSERRDFQSVLTEILRIKEPRAPEVPLPETGRWPCADVLLGDGWSIAYRVLDAQFFGVAQRRRRIYLVADFEGQCAGKVLFESEGVSGYSTAGFRKWQDTAKGFENRVGAADGGAQLCLNDQGVIRMTVTEEKVCTLRAESNHPPLVFENHRQDSRYKGPLKVAPTVSRTYGTGGNNQPLVVPAELVTAVDVRLTSERTRNARHNIYETDVSRCLDTGGSDPNANQGGLAIVEKPAYSVTTGKFVQVNKEKSPTILARDYKDPSVVCCGIGRDAFNQGANAKFKPSVSEELQPPIIAKGPGAVQQGFTVRRLMPAECALLQGFPSDWCSNLGTENPTEEEMAFWRGVFETYRNATGAVKKAKTDKQIRKWLLNPHSDSAEYRMWGNGVCLSVVWFVLAGIVHFAEQNISCK